MNVSPILFTPDRDEIPAVSLTLPKLRTDPNRRDTLGRSAVFMAAWHGQASVIHILCDWNADPNICHPDGTSPIFAAAQGGHEDAVRALGERGADPSAPRSNGARPLHVAALCGHEKVVHVLVSLGATPRILWRGVDWRRLGHVTGDRGTNLALRVLEFEFGGSRCCVADWKYATFLSPPRRYVLARRLKVPVPTPTLCTLCILKLCTMPQDARMHIEKTALPVDLGVCLRDPALAVSLRALYEVWSEPPPSYAESLLLCRCRAFPLYFIGNEC
jgi:hypothetical protein